MAATPSRAAGASARKAAPKATRATTAKAASTARKSTSGNGRATGFDGGLDAKGVDELLKALRSLKDGDFKVRMSTRRGGASAEVAQAFNEIVDMNARSNRELSRISRVIGREGRMAERASLPGSSGDWEQGLESVNSLIDDLVRPTTEVARVIVAVAEGDLTQKMALKIEDQPVKGEFLRIGTTVNAMVDQLSAFAEEVTRVAREVGTEGKLGGQANVKGVSGTWRDLTENVNMMAGNLTSQVRDVARVATAVASGDLDQKITVDARGEILELKDTINTMVDQLSSFAGEVTRVAHEVGTEGRLGGQADVKGVSGTWRALTDSVNMMAGNLTSQVRDIARVATAVANGDLDQKINVDVKGEILELKQTINTMVDQLSSFAGEVTRVAHEVGTEGKLGGQADVKGVSGTWRALTDSVNMMAGNLTSQVRDIARVATAVANGDLDQKITVDVKGEILELKTTLNTMVDQLSSFAGEVTRVAHEVGTEGELGGQADVKGVSGTWRALTDSVNMMAGNLTSQVRDIARVATAVANGDLDQKISVEVKGEILELKTTLNTMVDQLSSFAGEVTRVAREVGTEGKLGGQARVEGVSGTWRDLTENVNGMAGNLTSQVRDIARVATAVANGDLDQKITVDVKGEILELKQTVNTMVDQLSAFAGEVTRVAHEVGTEGELGGQAEVKGVSGTWRALTDSVNMMAGNLTSQVRDIARVATAVANGDLDQKITVDARGEILELKDTVNIMVDQLSSFAGEVTRVAREVGTEGKLGGQARVEGVSGTWRDLTENVNLMAGNLTSQVRDIAQVATAVAQGDLDQKVTVDVKGEILELKDTLNTMVDQLRAFASEVTRVAREVGTEGELGGQAEVKGVSGTWRGLTENVNLMASNLTDQVRDIARVATAVARGDLDQKINVDARGEILELKTTLNTMVDQLSSFAGEVTRVAREVGTEGRLGGQAEVEGVSGTWRDLTENVNLMATNLTGQVRDIARVATAVAQGDLDQKITVDARGEILQLKDTLNTMVDQLSSFADEVTRVAQEVGTEGRLGGQAEVRGVAGTWKDLTDNVNFMASNLTDQVRNIAQVATAVAQGDLDQKITVDARGEILQLKDTINTMVDQLRAFAGEVTRVAREVGTEGKLGGQAQVEGVSGTWRGLTENVNLMATNLTNQVRDVARVSTAVANGDLNQKITVDARGEILELKTTLNTMVDQLSSFAAEVTRVAREVGTEGKLGGQARVEGVSGTWRDLTQSVNQLAGNLTTQVRAIAEVSTAVTQGDLTRSITVDAAGEVADLKDNINQMITNLRATTQQNAEQDWLKTNLARITRMLQGQRDLETVSRLIMSEVSPLVDAQHGGFFMMTENGNGEGTTVEADAVEERELQLLATYGYKKRKNVSNRFKIGEGLVGQAALERKGILVTNPPDDYVKVTSGLGEATPRNIMVMPMTFEDQVLAVAELATLTPLSDVNQQFLDQLSETIGVVLNSIIANMRTEELLQQSQTLTQELQAQSEELQSQQEELRRSNAELEKQAASLKASEEMLQQQQEELQQTNEELEEKAALLAEQNRDIELKNVEIDRARRSLEDKARQLALSSKYKSEFLANMSHELRTPLNSLLILSKMLSDNQEGNLSEKQIDFARTIHAAGADLLTLINDILDLSKVEAGKMDVHIAPVSIEDVTGYAEQTFRPVADQQGLGFNLEVAEDVPVTLLTDEQRLQQVLKNLLSNAFKFTEDGAVSLRIHRTSATEPSFMENPPGATDVIAFSVSDTGIGIAEDKLRLIFEAFQQADGTTSRRYGGTGLGLSISREIARLLGGWIAVESVAGQGSTFTLYVPVEYRPPAEPTIEPVEVLDQPGDPDESGFIADVTTPVTTPDDDRDVIDPVLLRGEIPDDRADLQQGDRVVLIADDDAKRAQTALEVARETGFKALVALRLESAVALAHEFKPDGVMLVMGDAESPLSSLLERLKRHPDTRHIPTQVIGEEAHRQATLKAGAAGYAKRPATRASLENLFGRLNEFIDRRTRSVLVVDDDDTARESIAALIGSGEEIDVTGVGSSEEALAALDEHGPYDCIVLDLKLPKMTGFTLLERIKKEKRFRDTPVIVHTGKELTQREETRLRKYAETIVVKDVKSPERLLDETSLHLHRREAALPSDQRAMLEQLHQADQVFHNKTVLVVDDDVRNVFALTSALELRGMHVLYGENGREGIEVLEQNPNVSVVLMDLMMPEMDGYETMRAIREREEFQRLPIIALTAKAMRGDREKSIAAGASDYITKPVDIDQLLSLMRVWLY